MPVAILAVAAVCGALLGCAVAGNGDLAPLAILFLTMFIVSEMWPLVLGFGLWIGCFPPVNPRGWAVLTLAAFAAALIASWRFQTLRPWDLYHSHPMRHEREASTP